MSNATRLVAFAALLVAVLTGSRAAGAALGPFDSAKPAPAHAEHAP